MDVGDDEVRLADVNVERDHRQHHAADPAEREHRQEPQREQHRGIEMQHAAPQRGQPGEDLDARGDRDDRGGDHHRDPDPRLHSGHEHVVRPHCEAEHHDRQQRERHHPVAEDRFSRLHRDDLGDDPEAGQHHDVDGGVRVEPEDVLIAEHVAAVSRLEEVRVQDAVEHDEELRAGDERGRDDDE